MSKIAFINPTRGGPRGTKGFLTWLRDRAPNYYRPVMEEFQNGQLSGLGLVGPGETEAASEKPLPASVGSTIKDIIAGLSTAYLTKTQADAQKKVLDLQIKRAQAGLAPYDIDLQQYASGPTVNVGMSPEVKQMLIWGGIGLAVVLLLPKLLKR